MRAIGPVPFLSVLFLSFSLSQAALEIRIKTDQSGLFRTMAIEPPPIATLLQGEKVSLLHKGLAESEIKTQGGLRGWIRNADLEAVEISGGGSFRLSELEIRGDGSIGVIVLLDLPPQVPEVVSIDRNFSGEIIEMVDREQLEMFHDEN